MIDNRMTWHLSCAALILLFGLSSTNALAGSPLVLCDDGVPYLWPNAGVDIPFNPDRGDLGPLGGAEAEALTQQAFDQWGSVPSATASYYNAGLLPIDIDDTNFGPYLDAAAPDGLSAIVFDETGAIFDLLFGSNSGVLGIAGPEWGDPATCEILEGVAFFNGSAFDSVQVALDSMVHEFGHYTNLAHSVVNGQILFGDTTGPTPYNTFPVPSDFDRIETMYPFYLGPNAGLSTLHADDIAILSTLYPAPEFFTTTATISGTIHAANGRSPVTGVHVIARNIDAPFADAISAISGDFAESRSSSNGLVGTYTLNGLTPDAQYVVLVDGILSGGFSTMLTGRLPGPEEFYSGNAESSSDDPPSDFVPLSVLAGTRQAGVDIVFNQPQPGEPLPLGDDGSVELSIPFTFQFCGQSFDSLFVNANGNITFGRSSASYNESVAGMVSGPPRIAGLWDDLVPAAGGMVTFEQTRSSFTVKWVDVPEHPDTGTNSFAISLFGKPDTDRWGKCHWQRCAGNRFSVSYGEVTSKDGIAGYSCGAAITSGFESETNLSALLHGYPRSRHSTTLFEKFTGDDDPVDLAGRELHFSEVGGFEDAYEGWGGNDSVRTARRIRLPFSSAKDFTEIHPGDVDFFEFRVESGDILAVEVVRSQADTLLGLFNADTGALLLADDDGGSRPLSRIIVEAVEDLHLAVAVSSYPDNDFTGAGQGSGRYVLEVRSYRGEVLAAGDDTAIKVNLEDFAFPYQGGEWDTLYVSSNGNITFGDGDADHLESVTKLLDGPPRIAPLWDDLSPAGPSNGGLIVVDQNRWRAKIHFVSVPEFWTSNPNYFTVRLSRSGRIDFSYGAMARSDALVGISEGKGAADPGATNLSCWWPHTSTGTVYELFPTVPGDLSTFDLCYDHVAFVPYFGHGRDAADADIDRY